MNSREFQERLAARTRYADVQASPELLDKLEIYFRLLAIWNQKINLTALPLTDPPPETIDRLLIEPLIAARFVAPSAKLLMDVGSGGGSPAIPLALAVPRLELLMVESRTRKSVFLREAIRALEMNSAEVATARFEQLLVRPNLQASKDLVTLRAVRVEPSVLGELERFLKPGGHLFLFRSAGRTEASSTPSLELVATYPLIDPNRSQLAVLQKR